MSQGRSFSVLIILLVMSLVSLCVHAQDEQDILEDIVSEFVTSDGAALAVQVTTPDGTWAAVGGLADETRPATPADQFRIGSMSKTFVAVTTLMLVEDGVFKLDDPARTWLPTDIVENTANAGSVTIRQLLSMRSGIDDYLGTEEFWDAALDDPTHKWTPAEALTYGYGLDPLFAPDEAYSYSNSNYLLVQLILEKASGKPLHKLMRTKIFDPLKLKDTYTQTQERQDDTIVYGYEDMDGDGTMDEVSTFNDGAGLGDGGIVSNVADVTTFYKALLQDQTLLSEESMTLLMDFQEDDEGSGYSLGLGSSETDYGQAIGHSGAVSGFVSDGFYLPDYEAIVIVLSASADSAPDEIATAAVDALLDEEN